MRACWLLLGLLLLVGCGGGGGGSAPPPLQSQLSGRVFWIESGGPTVPPSTVRSGASSTQTDPADGFFELQVPNGTSQATVSYASSSGGTVVRTFTFEPIGGDFDLGDLYIGPQVVRVVGRVVSAADGRPIGLADVSLAGRRARSGSDGRFTLNDVAYSSTNLAVFLGLQGRVTATGFFARLFSPPGAAVSGVVQVGDLALSPDGAIDPPPPPANIVGTVGPDGGSAEVKLLQGTTVLREVRADSLGRYQLWAGQGTYTVRATKGAKTGVRSVTVTDTSVILTVNVTLN